MTVKSTKPIPTDTDSKDKYRKKLTAKEYMFC